MEVVRRTFRPEFLNRVDEILVFHRLTREDLSRIVDLQVELLRGRLAARRLTLDLAPGARDWLAEHGYDPGYGARPLKRLIQKEITDRLAAALLEGRFGDGDTVRVEAAGDGLALVAAG
jgi:ATP-dependent Clp protease ATP-binding subunit ClpB